MKIEAFFRGRVKAISEYLATSFTFVATFSRTRYNTIGTFVIAMICKEVADYFEI